MMTKEPMSNELNFQFLKSSSNNSTNARKNARQEGTKERSLHFRIIQIEMLKVMSVETLSLVLKKMNNYPISDNLSGEDHRQ